MIYRLTRQQRQALLDLMIYLARVDGRVDNAEQRILADYADFADAQTCTLPEQSSLEDLVRPFESPESRVVVLQELLRLAHSHKYFATEEQSALVEVAALMGLPMDLLGKIEGWVVEGLAWERKGDQLVGEAERLARR
ncbi:MAG: hypothetical protein ACLFTT_01885 [Candidatus Hydrogenedentota bacterium]